jgi:hypothetical protein
MLWVLLVVYYKPVSRKPRMHGTNSITFIMLIKAYWHVSSLCTAVRHVTQIYISSQIFKRGPIKLGISWRTYRVLPVLSCQVTLCKWACVQFPLQLRLSLSAVHCCRFGSPVSVFYWRIAMCWAAAFELHSDQRQVQGGLNMTGTICV